MTAPGRPPIPPPPPSLPSRLRAWVRRQDRAGRRGALLVGTVLAGAAVAWTLVALLGFWLQPRFTVLELAAQRLAPDPASAQPAREEVARFGAFDRGYAVQFPTPDGGLDRIIDRARRQRWLVVARDGPDRVAMEREGVAATVVAGPATTVAQTRVAAWVRIRQRQARTAAAVVGGAAAVAWIWRQIRRRPRPVR